MTWLISIAISNAVLATLLGILAYLVSRISKNAALSHALWILVLIKLVTPPIVEVRLPVMPTWAIAATQSLDRTADLQVSGRHARQLSGAESGPESANWPGPIDEAASSAPLTGSVDVTAHRVRLAKQGLLWIWLLGIAIYASYKLYVTWQMGRLMRLATPDPRIDRAMSRIAKAAHVKNYPTARVVPWVGSPMLWGLGSSSVIVLPQELFEALDEKATDTLLQHELAHFQRRDPWIRILEVIASTLYWWHPLVWWAMREIEVHEEQCCDAWVVRQDKVNRRRYAEALLDTVDFISEASDAGKPIAATGLGRVPLLKQRLKAIMQGRQHVLDYRMRFALSLLLVVVPLQPKLVAAAYNVDLTPQSLPTSGAGNPPEVVSTPPRGPNPPSPTTTPIPHSVDVLNLPSLDYAKATSAYGTYELVATSGYRAELRRVIDGQTIDLGDNKITCAAFVPPNDEPAQLVVGCLDGSVWLFDCRSGEVIKQLGSYDGVIYSVAFSPTGQWLAVGGRDRIVRLIDISHQQSARTIEGTDAAVRCVRFSADGTRLAVVTDTTWHPERPGRVDIWDLSTMAVQQTIWCPSAVGIAGFDATGNILTAEWNGILRVWSSSGEQLSASLQPKDSVSAAAFSPDAMSLDTLGLAAQATSMSDETKVFSFD